MTQLSSAQIDKQIDQLRQAILKEEEGHRKLAFEYTETGDKSLMEKMTKIRNTITFYRDTISANEEVRKVALKREAQEYDEEREREHERRMDDLKKLFAQRVEIAKKLDRKFAELGKIMEDFQDITKRCREDSPKSILENSGLIHASIFNQVPQIFGWRNSIHKAGLADMAGPNFNRRFDSDPYADASLANCIHKQHEMLASWLTMEETEDV